MRSRQHPSRNAANGGRRDEETARSARGKMHAAAASHLVSPPPPPRLEYKVVFIAIVYHARAELSMVVS